MPEKYLINTGLILIGLIVAFVGRKVRRAVLKERISMYLSNEITDKEEKRLDRKDALASVLLIVGGLLVGSSLMRMVY